MRRGRHRRGTAVAFAALTLALAVASVNASLVVAAAGPSLPEPVSIALARTVAAHIASVLGSK